MCLPGREGHIGWGEQERYSSFISLAPLFMVLKQNGSVDLGTKCKTWWMDVHQISTLVWEAWIRSVCTWNWSCQIFIGWHPYRSDLTRCPFEGQHMFLPAKGGLWAFTGRSIRKISILLRHWAHWQAIRNMLLNAGNWVCTWDTLVRQRSKAVDRCFMLLDVILFAPCTTLLSACCMLSHLCDHLQLWQYNTAVIKIWMSLAACTVWDLHSLGDNVRHYVASLLCPAKAWVIHASAFCYCF